MKKTIKLLDLDCGHCADKIQNAVKKIDGVEVEVETTFDHNGTIIKEKKD